jgi:hypothetical protein
MNLIAKNRMTHFNYFNSALDILIFAIKKDRSSQNGLLYQTKPTYYENYLYYLTAISLD